MDFFDETKFYKETLAPMIMDFKRECSAHNIPFFITVATKNSEAGTVYHSDMILASAKTHLSDDRISKLLLRVNGFHTTLPARVKKSRADPRRISVRCNKEGIDRRSRSGNG